MDNIKGSIISSIIISIALVICVSMMKNAYMNKSVPETNSYFNADLSQVENAIRSQSKEVFNIDEAAKYLGIDSVKLSNMVYNGKAKKDIPCVFTDGHVLFSKKALDEWVYSISKGIKK